MNALKKYQRITVVFLLLIGIVNYLDRSALSIANTSIQRDMLISLGCLTWQGYLFGRPGPAAELQAAAAAHAVVVP